jgi:hypothetical protein
MRTTNNEAAPLIRMATLESNTAIIVTIIIDVIESLWTRMANSRRMVMVQTQNLPNAHAHRGLDSTMLVMPPHREMPCQQDPEDIIPNGENSVRAITEDLAMIKDIMKTYATMNIV